MTANLRIPEGCRCHRDNWYWRDHPDYDLVYADEHWTVHYSESDGYHLVFHNDGYCSSFALGNGTWSIDHWCNPKHPFRGHASPPYPATESLTRFMTGVWWHEVMCGDSLQLSIDLRY